MAEKGDERPPDEKEQDERHEEASGDGMSSYRQETRGAGNGGGSRRIHGGPGKFYCVLCRCKRDHVAAACPGGVCWTCGERGHHANECKVETCIWCHATGHRGEDCEKGGADHFRKRKFAAVGTTGGPAAKTTVTYASTVKGKPCSVVAKISSLLEESNSSFQSKVDEVVERRRVEHARHEAALQREQRLHEERLCNLQEEHDRLVKERQETEELSQAVARLLGKRPPLAESSGSEVQGTCAREESSVEGIASAISVSTSVVTESVVGVECKPERMSVSDEVEDALKDSNEVRDQV